MRLSDLHTHTTFCDGKSSPREVVEAAIEKGLVRIGFSAHSFTEFDQRYCILPHKTADYFKEISALKTEFKGKIEILCGVEQDFYATFGTFGFDYVIGSVHYLKFGDEYVPVDETPEILTEAARKHFDGDIYALCEKYFATVADVVSQTGADIIGHFDLISKFNEGGALFDERHPRYVAAYEAALDRLLEFEVPFELNTGAISRGYKTHPYPSRDQLSYLASRGGKVILTGDTHSKENLCFQFEKWKRECEELSLECIEL